MQRISQLFKDTMGFEACKPEFPFSTHQHGQYIPSRHLLILRVAFFRLEAGLGCTKVPFLTCRKRKTGKSHLSRKFHGHLSAGVPSPYGALWASRLQAVSAPAGSRALLPSSMCTILPSLSTTNVARFA